MMDAPGKDIADQTRTFATPLELAGSRPRDVRLTAGGKAVYVVAMAMFAAALVAGMALYLLSGRQAEARRVFERDGVYAEASVTRLWRKSGDSKDPMVAYRFEAGGAIYDGTAKIRLAAWRRLESGSPIAVRYLPADPSTNAVAGAERGVTPPWVAFLVAAGLALGGAAVLAGLNGQRRLLMEGRAAPAVVTAIVKQANSHSGSHRAIKYTFRLLSGATATGKSEASRKPPAVGTVICVVYDPDVPRRSRPYPFPLVRTSTRL